MFVQRLGLLAALVVFSLLTLTFHGHPADIDWMSYA